MDTVAQVGYNTIMFKVVASASERAVRAAITGWARTREHCALRYPATYGRGRWLLDLVDALRADEPRTIFVRVPQDPDRVERVILDIAGGLDPDLVEPVAAKLRSEPDVLGETLDLLSHARGECRLIVDGWSALESTEETYAVGHALDVRTEAVRSWIASHAWIIADCAMTAPGGFETRTVRLDSEAPPSALQNGVVEERPDLWERFSPDVGAYETALALIALEERNSDRPIPPAWKLREHVSRSLPPAARELLYVASVHARPLSLEVVAQLEASDSARDLLVRLGICHLTPIGLLADPAWTSWCLEADDVRRNGYHVTLARTFATLANPTDASADRAAIPILEAHRHYLAAGEYESAKRFARYSAAMLVEEGKRRSLIFDYAGAARLYQGILELADAGQLGVGRRLRGYVKHYVHFNLAKAEAENFRDTERGYLESVDLWSENALFWSRLIRTQVYRGSRGEALQTLARAKQEVPSHPDKATALIARTVRGLLEKRHHSSFLVEALLIWDDYRPTTDFAKEVEDTLEGALARGWSTRSLDVPDLDPIWFLEPQRVRICRSADFWFAELQDLNYVQRGPTPKEALINLGRGLREEVMRLVRALTHTLEPQTRLQKQILLGVIDVIASRLDAPALDHVWLVGDIQRTGNEEPSFVTSGSQVLVFEIPQAMQQKLVVNDVPYLAQVAAGPSGVPIGPLLSLEPAYGSAESVMEAWFKKVRDAG